MALRAEIDCEPKLGHYKLKMPEQEGIWTKLRTVACDQQEVVRLERV